MAYGGLGMNTAREILGEIGALVSLPVSDVHTPDNRPTLPVLRGESALVARQRCKYTNLPDFHGEHSQH